MSEYYYEERPNRFYCKKYLINRSACTTLLDGHEVCELLNNLERKLEEARKKNEELLIKLKVHKNEALSLAENVKFRELKE
tara:strand:- start:362 stop:604 length:243 start_codon:yes stop_codon:yes gene_type:complete